MTWNDHIISVQELAVALESTTPPVLLDVRWRLDKSEGLDDFAAGHVPGALYVSLDDQLASHDHADPTVGRHPLPTPADFEATVRSWGIDASTPVVVYDDNAALGAARAWWLLRWAGHSNVRVLDGGLGAWKANGGALEEGARREAAGASAFTISPGSLPTTDADGIAALAHSSVVLDARAGARYRGETEPLDPRAGHIPGALSAPVTENVRPEGTFLSADALRERLAGFGIDETTEVGVYCGSGVTAAHNALVFAAVHGRDAVLYPASWSGWSSDPERPAATGPEA